MSSQRERETRQETGQEMPAAPAIDSSPPAGAVADTTTGATPDRLAAMESGMAEIKELLKSQQAGSVEKEWYSVDEVAELAKLAVWTIRNACREGRIKAEKGPDGQWRIHRDELGHIQNHGLRKKG